MSTSHPRRILLVLFLALLPATLSAQQKAKKPAAPASSAPAQTEIQGWLTELQQLHGRLEAVQAQALQDPQISTQQKALGSSIKAAMERIDPSLQKSLSRMEALETQAEEAQKSGNETRLQQLGQEAQQIQRQFATAQQRALQQPDLAARMLEFQEDLQNKMLEVDPEAQKLITRYQELESKLSAAMQGAGR